MTASRPSLGALAAQFFTLGLSAFGGPAMIRHIRRVAAAERGWLDAAAFDDGVALCQMIPGATAMQAAAYVGFRLRGYLGAAAAFVPFALPAFFIMTLFGAFYERLNACAPVVAALSELWRPL